MHYGEPPKGAVSKIIFLKVCGDTYFIAQIEAKILIYTIKYDLNFNLLLFHGREQIW